MVYCDDAEHFEKALGAAFPNLAQGADRRARDDGFHVLDRVGRTLNKSSQAGLTLCLTLCLLALLPMLLPMLPQQLPLLRVLPCCHAAPTAAHAALLPAAHAARCLAALLPAALLAAALLSHCLLPCCLAACCPAACCPAACCMPNYMPAIFFGMCTKRGQGVQPTDIWCCSCSPLHEGHVKRHAGGSSGGGKGGG